MSELENIKLLYSKIEDKDEIHRIVSDYFKIEVSSVRTGWFTRFEIPKKYRVRENLVVILQNYIYEKARHGRGDNLR